MSGKEKNIWVVILNSNKARFFLKRARNDLTELEYTMTSEAVLTNIESRRSLGRVHDRFGPARHITEPSTPVKELELRQFMQEVAKFLEKGLKDELYHHLILSAPPKALGVIRQLLCEDVKACVQLEWDKDLVYMAPRKIEEHIEKANFFPKGVII